MTKRFIVATFADGTKLTRTTNNPDLRFAWRVTGTWKYNNRSLLATGFSSTYELASKAAYAANKHCSEIHGEIVMAIEVAKPVKPKPTKGGFKVRRTWTSVNGHWYFMKVSGKRNHMIWPTRDAAQTFIDGMRTSGCNATYEIV